MQTPTDTQPIDAAIGITKTVYVDHGPKQFIQIIDSTDLSAENKKILKAFRKNLPDGPFAIDFVDVTLPLLSLDQLTKDNMVAKIAAKIKQDALPAELYPIVAKLGKLDLMSKPLASATKINGLYLQVTQRKAYRIIKKLQVIMNPHYMSASQGTIVLFGAFRALEQPERAKKNYRRSPAFDLVTAG